MPQPCYAPTFEGSSAISCLILKLVYALILAALIIAFLLTFGSKSILCKIRRLIFRMENCRRGNSNPEIDLSLDAYTRHVQSYRNQYGKSAEWEQWMLDNRDRYEDAFNKARARPSTLNIAFRYESEPLAYDPAWASDTEHMTALENLAEPCYAGYDFEFIFNGNTTSSYANVVAGISSTTSHASGKTVYLYFETIFNHEFAHLMRVPHHYDSDAETGNGQHMPPGDSQCLMDRTSNQFCSACRTALHIPLDVDNDAAIAAAVQAILDRYPY